MIPAAIHTPTMPKLFELLNDCVSWKAMTLPRMVSVALTRGIARRVFLPTIAERCPSLDNHPICALPMLHAFAITRLRACNKHSIRAGRGHRITHMQFFSPGFLTTAFLEKGEPFRERSPQHSVSTTGLAPFASQPMGPSSLKTALEAGRGRRRLRPYILHAKDFRGVTEPALRMTSPTPPSMWARSRPLRASNRGLSCADLLLAQH